MWKGCICIILEKLCIFIDELPSETGAFHGAFDKMKHYVTEPSIYVEPKGREGYETDNMCNFMMVSNNVFSLKVEQSDRRYHCQKVSSAKRGDKEYWRDLCDNVLTPEMGVVFTKYLWNLPKENLVSLRDIPDTQLRRELQENSEISSIKFLKDLINHEYEIKQEDFIPEFENKVLGKVVHGISRDSLYRKFGLYCESTGEKTMKKKVFISSIKYMIESHRCKLKGKPHTVFNLGDIGYKREEEIQ